MLRQISGPAKTYRASRPNHRGPWKLQRFCPSNRNAGGIRNRRLRRSFAQGARYFFPGANFLRGNLKESLGSDLTFAKLINRYSVAGIARFLAGGISN